jgi:hypothetical protein
MRLAQLGVLSLLFAACIEQNPTPPLLTDPWRSWERIELPYNLSIAIPPGYQINHRYDPADSLVYGCTWAQFLSPDTTIICYSGDELTYFTRGITGPYTDFETATGHAGAIVVEQWFSSWLGSVYLQTEDRQLYRKILSLSIESLTRMPEITLMAQSMEYR